MRNSHQLRVRASMPGVVRRTWSHTRGKSFSASSASTIRNVPSRSSGRANALASFGIEIEPATDAMPYPNRP